MPPININVTDHAGKLCHFAYRIIPLPSDDRWVVLMWERTENKGKRSLTNMVELVATAIMQEQAEGLQRVKDGTVRWIEFTPADKVLPHTFDFVTFDLEKDCSGFKLTHPKWKRVGTEFLHEMLMAYLPLVFQAATTL